MSGEVLRQKREGLLVFLSVEGNNANYWSRLREEIAFDQRTAVDKVPNIMIDAFLDKDSFTNLGPEVEMRRFFHGSRGCANSILNGLP